MINIFSLLLLLIQLSQTLMFTLAISTTRPFNISHYLYPKISDELRPQPSLFFQEVFEVISAKQKWKLEDIKASKLEVRKARYGSLCGYEFGIRFGKSELIFMLFDEVSVWKKLKKGGDFESLTKKVDSLSVLDGIRIKGPFELRISGDNEISLMLPQNTSYSGLKRVLVGEGITVELRGAQEVSFLHKFNFGPQANTNDVISRKGYELWSLKQSFCMPLLPIHVSGSVSVVAYRTQSPYSCIQPAFLSRTTIELLPGKCYIRHPHQKLGSPIDSLNLRILLLENLLKSFSANRTVENGALRFLKAKMQASTLLHFQLELQRDVGSNDTLWTTLDAWRTRPTVERAWFLVVAKIEGERLNPILVKKIRHIADDSWDLSNLMSNVSFTKYPSMLVPPEALTLDVRW